jgi:hypothetical protein
MDYSKSLIVLLIVVLAIVGYLWLNQSLTSAEGPVSTTPSVPPASAPAPAPP